ncbi:hypothetical protein [Draconibacterium halophilum]|uniref:Uncharacterized protein n=1 Tax=Draconibacterium halophilum TaxID=2706887 RepID=A0A6C0RDY6_9BACT|nr:hypothetical protein [Draconibacterium halophilum]QIA08329.1 hypothetical protein G0Q07_11665 [Draconibacterium halophilum]
MSEIIIIYSTIKFGRGRSEEQTLLTSIMNILKNTFFWLILLFITLPACDKDDELNVVSNREYNVGITIMGGYSQYISIFNGSYSGSESSVAFKPLKEGKIKEMQIKVSRNSLSENGKVVLRKNGNDSLIQEIEKGKTGYFVASDSIQLLADDEINLYVDASSQKQGEIELSIRVIIDYP